MKVKVLKFEYLTYNVKRLRVSKPKGYKFIPGQAVDISLGKEAYQEDKHPFTFTSLNSDPFLEFTIKEYSGITKIIHNLKIGDELIIGKPFGTINYKGRGTFIAGGAGITPFIAIFKDLIVRDKLLGNKLIYTNKTKDDIILEDWLKQIFPKNDLILTLTKENKSGYENDRINEKFLKKHIKNWNQYFYVCGKGSMIKDLRDILPKLGVSKNKIIYEK